MTKMENFLMEDDQNGRQQNWKMTKMEADQNGRRANGGGPLYPKSKR